MQTMFTMPPPVCAYFDKFLLGEPMKTFGDTLERLWDMYNLIDHFYMKKVENLPIKKQKCIELQNQIREILYEIEKKEKLKAETTDLRKRPLYFVRCTSERRRRVFQGLRNKRFKYAITITQDNF